MVPLRLVVIAALAWRRRWLQVGAFVGATVTSELCIGPLKALIDRPRPLGAQSVTDSASFPSGHAIASSVTAIGLVVVLVPAAERRTRWTIAAAVFAILMATSRTYLGVHWASDVVAGACIGTGLAVVWSAALELERDRRRRSPSPTDVDRRGPRRTATPRVVSVAMLTVGGTCIAALHLLRRDLPPGGHRISEYALGPYGWLMAVAFVSIGVGVIVLGWALVRARDRWCTIVGLTMVAAGVAMVAAGIWRTDPHRSGVATDAIHSTSSAAATIALIATAVTWSVVLRRRGDGTRAARTDLAAVLALVACALGALSPSLHRSSLTGLSQRVLWLTLLSWLLVTAWRLTPRSDPAVSDPSAPAVTMTT
jgi:hypothetical protein